MATPTVIVKCKCGDGMVGTNGRCPCGLRAPGAAPTPYTRLDQVEELTVRAAELAQLERMTPKWRVFRRLRIADDRLRVFGQMLMLITGEVDEQPIETSLTVVPAGSGTGGELEEEAAHGHQGL